MIIKNRQTILQINIEIYLFIYLLPTTLSCLEFAYIYILFMYVLLAYILSMVQAFHLLTLTYFLKIMINPNDIIQIK